MLVARAAAAGMTVIDDFEDIGGWSAQASEGAQVWIAQEPGHTGQALRIDYDLGNGSGYIIVHKAVALSLPANFAFTFQMFGEGLRNNFEFKLIDPSQRNVWWYRKRDFSWPVRWQPMTVRKSRLELAWGTSPKVTPQKVAYIEFAIKASEGGSGSIWIDDLVLEDRSVAAHGDEPPTIDASSSAPGRDAPHVLDGDEGGWASAAEPEEQWLRLDFREPREYGGLVVDWDPDDYATRYDVEASSDGAVWSTLHETKRGGGGRDYLYLPDAESRYVRLHLYGSSRGRGYAIRRLAVRATTFSSSPNQFFTEVAAEERPGLYPKYFANRQTYWTIIGAEGDDKEALMNEEGALEVDRGGFSIEPFLYTGHRLVTWSDAECTQSLDDGDLPIPSVTRRYETTMLRVTAFAAGKPGASILYARYRIENRGGERASGRLVLAVRPFQVLPPWQSLNMVGGVSPIGEIRYEGGVVRVNRDKVIVPLGAPDEFGAASFEEVGSTEALLSGQLPAHDDVVDPSGFASAVLSYGWDLAPGDVQEVVLAIPFHEPYVEPLIAPGPKRARATANAEQLAVRKRWQTLLGRVDIDLPPVAGDLVRTMKTNVAYALVNRDGPALKPGSRNYARSWIRDGAATSAALLQMGFPSEVNDFIRWYASAQLPDGKVPCCIDRRGADLTAENDSEGEFVWLVGEYYRYTRDVGLVADLWPNVVAAVEYMAELRKRRLTDTYRTPEKEAYLGLLPESISHEGYSAHPVHSYWDDFWALAGFRTAPQLAAVADDLARVEEFTALRVDFEQSVASSIPKAMAMHSIDFMPGSVEYGDFDPTSTAVLLTAAGGMDALVPALNRTYDRYVAEVATRRDGTSDWEGYSPYEVRNVEALVRLGRRDDALALLGWLMSDRRPLAWNEWAEVSWRDRDAPKFIGDMPHTWIGSILVRSVRTLLVYERPQDHALVLAAGVPEAWVRSERGVSVRRLPTEYGTLSYHLRAEGPDSVHLNLLGDIAVPVGHVVLRSPIDRPITSVTIDGHPSTAFTDDEALIDRCPADVVLRYGAGPAAPAPKPQQNASNW
jgi:hypothetical protein